MDDLLKAALELVRAQASVRTMTAEEMMSMARAIARTLQEASQSDVRIAADECAQSRSRADKKQMAKAIKERSITCLECGKSFKIITRKHLAQHEMDPDGYREKWGYKKGVPLVCKSLQRARRKKMTDMQLWERRRVVDEKAKKKQ
ncbi:MucR family transcriptional regulator [Nitratidesulfovibrio termitidis]|uniref:MucR family transcriptional regulator n=1 Tax=Nitratidesulfovibrio termitidis TaxID=42252 RepID=UPI00055252AD|nr:MucR family transcriptional regulator [Nitratidesulfovibrio termitidis]